MRIILPLAFLFCSSLNAQTTFAPVGAKWTFMQYSFPGMPPDSALVTVECTGDTIIQERTCSRLSISGSTGCMYFHEHLTLDGDTVLFHDAVEGRFRTLYVIGAPVGTSWQTILTSAWWDLGELTIIHDTLNFTVTSSDTIIIDGTALRRIEVDATPSLISPFANYPFPGFIIERIGHLGYLFPWSDAACDMEGVGPLRCYQDPDITWLNQQFPQCELSVGLNEVHAGSSFGIRPTLAATGETIQLNGPQGTVIILDAVGRVVLQKAIEGPASFDLDMPGTYIVRFTTSDGRTAHQRIVLR